MNCQNCGHHRLAHDDDGCKPDLEKCRCTTYEEPTPSTLMRGNAP